MNVSLFNRKDIRIICTLLLVAVLFLGCIPKKYLITDPVEAHERAWSRFDFFMDEKYQTDHFTWFLLRTPEYVETYYKLLKQKTPVPEETVQKEMEAVKKYLIVEVNLEAINKKDLELEKLKFRLYDDRDNRYSPISIDASDIMLGEEYTRSFSAHQPVTLVKKRGNVTVESITPTFYTPDTATSWLRTLVLYFPRYKKDSDTPIVNENSGTIKVEAKLKRTITSRTLRGRWDAGELVKNPEKWREYYKGP